MHTGAFCLAPFQIQMTLIQKGIVLLATPILAQFIFVIALLCAYRSAEELTFKDIQYRNQTAELMDVSLLCYKSMGLLTTMGVSQDDSLLPAFDQVYEKLVRKREYLDLMALDNHSAALLQARDSLNKALKIFADARQMTKLKVKLFSSNVLLALELQRDLEDAQEGLDKLISERSSSGLGDAKSIEQGRWLVIEAVVAGFIANMLMSAGLLAFFGKDFASRFSVLLDNTNRVPQGLPLNPKISGKDELAQLDLFFHEMTRALHETEQRKEQLVSMVTHDLRNPLSALNLSLDMIIIGQLGDVNERVMTRITKSKQIVKRLSSLVNDILDLEKLRSGKLKIVPTVLDAESLVKECVAEIESIADKSQLTLRIDLAGVKVVADKERLSQVFINLMGNALKFSPKGAEVLIDSVTAGEFIRFQIKDKGPGVPEQYKDIIFLPFEQVPD
ncbi:MAG: HAMP domain-containing histidine kinase, partial [Candidatus Obscuribacterales bacterium]|nr:HAMP domain-containing histidine kinase [Candidatus Obscuribacterales bacterium]